MDGSPLHSIRTLEAGDLAGFSALLELYEASFPSEERKSAAWLREMLASHSYRFLLLGSPTIQAFAIAMRSVTEPITLLEYMAVAPANQGQGFGRALFQHVAAATLAEGRSLVIEIEAGASNEQVRRRRFYLSQGAHPLVVPYTMPQVASAPPPPMELLWIPAPERMKPSGEEKARWVSAIHREVYGYP